MVWHKSKCRWTVLLNNWRDEYWLHYVDVVVFWSWNIIYNSDGHIIGQTESLWCFYETLLFPLHILEVYGCAFSRRRGGWWTIMMIGSDERRGRYTMLSVYLLRQESGENDEHGSQCWFNDDSRYDYQMATEPDETDDQKQGKWNANKCEDKWFPNGLVVNCRNSKWDKDQMKSLEGSHDWINPRVEGWIWCGWLKCGPDIPYQVYPEGYTQERWDQNYCQNPIESFFETLQESWDVPRVTVWRWWRTWYRRSWCHFLFSNDSRLLYKGWWVLCWLQL